MLLLVTFLATFKPRLILSSVSKPKLDVTLDSLKEVGEALALGIYC